MYTFHFHCRRLESSLRTEWGAVLICYERGWREKRSKPCGAGYGTGYCDAGCPKSAWINGVANVNGTRGACCAELDIWEANSRASAFALHPCRVDGVYECEGNDGCEGVCAASGCGYNTYELGEKEFYGLGKVLDTRKSFTVVTRFETGGGELTEVKQIYVQDGKVIESPEVDFGYWKIGAATDAYCAANSPKLFSELGGAAHMGRALQSGMVPILCIWNQGGGGFMNWLDSGESGPCNKTEGDPALIVKENPGTPVTFSDIRWGDIGSTYDI